MKKLFSVILAGLMLLPLTACGGTGTDDTTSSPEASSRADGTTAAPDGSETTSVAESSVNEETNAEQMNPRDPSEKFNVLIIGNSFTYYNDMNKPSGIFYNIAKRAGYSGVKVTTVYKGAYHLRQFLDEKDEYGKQVLTYLRSSTKYDIVIIQEQSSTPISNPGDFYDSCREFKKLVDANGGEMWLYETWGYKPGHSDLAAYGPTSDKMEMKLRAAYKAIGDELGVGVCYAGAAFTASNKLNPRIDLYHTDAKHPSVAGSTLIAWTLFGTIFGVDPVTLDYNGSLSADEGAALKKIASDIIKSDNAVAAEYVTSSENVHRIDSDTGVSGAVDSSKTVMLSALPKNPIISVITRPETATGNGWMTNKQAAGTFSGIRGDKDAIASTEYSAEGLGDAQKADIADIGYGVSVIGIEYMDDSKTGTNNSTAAGKSTSVGNLVNGHWGSSYMAAMFFDSYKYNIKGEKDDSANYSALITLNFGEKKEFEAIGYFSGSLQGFAQAQDVYVSDDGVNWEKVPSACYDAAGTPLKSLDTAKTTDPWNNNKPTVLAAFSMAGVSGKYIRIGILKGGEIGSNNTGRMEINTREIVVFGK
ncbi:MAG: discoidin domain-containing protein [Clostridia bacterium]|nr:discoidin domain-containing protein [Clostridia bacterium]